MKSPYHFILLAIFSLSFFSCDNEFTDMGSGIQPEGDRVIVLTDTFHLTTANLFIDGIHHRPDLDSLLLGTFVDNKFGTTQADILARFEPPFEPTGFRFMPNTVVDSAFLILAYRTWFGAQNSVMSVQAFEKNRGRFLDFYEPYFTNANPFDFVDIGNQVLIAETALTANEAQVIKLRLTDDFTNRLFENSRDFTTETDFFERFNGMWITSLLGDATMLHLRAITMTMFHHHPTTIAGRDTIISNTTDFVVNKVVINRFSHPDADEIRSFLEANDSINYVASPAKIYTQVNIPLRRIVQSMVDSVGDRLLAVNSAIVRVEAKDTRNVESSNIFQVPVPSSMLIMPKSEMDMFFKQGRLPTDSIVFAPFVPSDSSYSFNIARYIDREIRRVRASDGTIDTNLLDETMEMVLVPVRITTAQTQAGTQITAVRQQILMNGVSIRGGNDPNRPMRISLLYSGF